MKFKIFSVFVLLVSSRVGASWFAKLIRSEVGMVFHSVWALLTSWESPWERPLTKMELKATQVESMELSELVLQKNKFGEFEWSL